VLKLKPSIKGKVKGLSFEGYVMAFTLSTVRSRIVKPASNEWIFFDSDNNDLPQQLAPANVKTDPYQ